MNNFRKLEKIAIRWIALSTLRTTSPSSPNELYWNHASIPLNVEKFKIGMFRMRNFCMVSVIP